MNDLISRRAVLAALTDISYNHCKTEGEAIVIDTAKTLVTVMPSAQPECDSHENDKVFVDKDAYEQCRFEYINACKITHNRTPDTRQSDINDAYAVIKALHPIFGEESF